MSTANASQIERAKEHFGKIIEEQFERIEKMKTQGDFVDYASKEKIIIGVVGGDGIGPFITSEAEKILKFLEGRCPVRPGGNPGNQRLDHRKPRRLQQGHSRRCPG